MVLYSSTKMIDNQFSDSAVDSYTKIRMFLKSQNSDHPPRAETRPCSRLFSDQ